MLPGTTPSLVYTLLMIPSSYSRSASAALVLLLILPTAPLAAQSGPDVARAYRQAHEPQLVRDFAELLRYPNRAFTPEIREAAIYIRDEMRAVGVDTRLVEIEGGSPLVLGELRVPGATRTLEIGRAHV